MDKGSRLVVLLVGILAVAVPLAMGTPLVYAKADKALNGRRRGRGPRSELGVVFCGKGRKRRAVVCLRPFGRECARCQGSLRG